MIATSGSTRVVVKVYAVAVGLYLLSAYAVQIHNGLLGDVWFEIAWGLAFGAVQSAGITAVKDTLVQLTLVQNRVTPQHQVRTWFSHLWVHQIIIVALGLSVLVVISHMKLDEHAAQAQPWLLPAFLWACTPLCMWTVIVWNRSDRWSMKILMGLLNTAALIGHRAFAFQLHAVWGNALIWGLLLFGCAGLMGAHYFLQKKTIWITDQSETLVSHFKLWLAQRLSGAKHVGSLFPLSYGLLITFGFSEKSSMFEWLKVWNNPELAAANVFLPIRCIFFAALMWASLCSERTHWRWQLLPGLVFRKHIGTEIFKTTAILWSILALVISVFFVVTPKIWQPDALPSLLYAVQWRLWPFLVDGIFALGIAVWLRSVYSTSWADFGAMGLIWLSFMFVDYRFFVIDRSFEQDICMLCIAWLLVLRANKNFETSNWSWLNKGRIFSAAQPLIKGT